jgi:hypothetical protein
VGSPAAARLNSTPIARSGQLRLKALSILDMCGETILQSHSCAAIEAQKLCR